MVDRLNRLILDEARRRDVKKERNIEYFCSLGLMRNVALSVHITLEFSGCLVVKDTAKVGRFISGRIEVPINLDDIFCEDLRNSADIGYLFNGITLWNLHYLFPLILCAEMDIEGDGLNGMIIVSCEVVRTVEERKIDRS